MLELPSHQVGSVYLFVQRDPIVNKSDSEESTGEQPEDSGDPLSQIKSVDAKQADQKTRVQYPRNVVIVNAGNVVLPRVLCHRWNQKQVDDPSDKEQTQGAGVENAGKRLPVVETVGSEEAEKPKNVTNGSRVLRFGSRERKFVRM